MSIVFDWDEANINHIARRRRSALAMERRVLPDFKSEAEEADWWFNHQDELLEDFKQAAADGTLGHGTTARLARLSAAAISLDPEDILLADEQASRRGMNCHIYMKTLIHEALLKAETQI